MGLAQTHDIIQSLEVALQRFQDHIHLRLSQYRSHQNAISPPLSEAPVKIFSHILQQSVAIHDWSTVRHWSIARLKELAQVAKAWKAVVLGTPEIWAVIKIRRWPDTRWRNDLDLVLARSRSAPLTIVYGVGKERSDGEQDYRTVEEIFKFIGDHASRFQTILYSGTLSPTVAVILELPTPSLRRIGIDYWDHYNSRGLSQKLSLSPGHQLFHVEAKNVALIWANFKDLTSLRLTEVGMTKENGRLVEDFLAVLQSCPDLELLNLEDTWSVPGGEKVGSMSEREIQDIMARSCRVKLPSLRSLTIKNSAPALALAIVFSVNATGVSELHLHVARYFLTALTDINTELLIKPAFDRAFDRNPKSRLYIVQHNHSLRIQNHGDGSWEKQAPRKTSFGLHILVDDEITEGDALAHLLEFLQCPSPTMPVQLELGFGNAASGNISCMLDFPVNILERVVELRLHGDLPEVLNYLSQRRIREGSNSEPTSWPCPRLAGIWINCHKWKHIIDFLERRYGPRPGGDRSVTKPERLPRIIFVQYRPNVHVLSRIEPFVERWKFVGECQTSIAKRLRNSVFTVSPQYKC
ncbi:hypothetical protein FRB94_014190 [Tulasnella sp. JGI-2019a]|nr:hypothetical protein FRB93_005462 [Tulasnella sp. JGI-2019a]KAG9014098.1 hypothetical protein FRB94_014190 [Tulasnella sp. JGI-2019a]